MRSACAAQVGAQARRWWMLAQNAEAMELGMERLVLPDWEMRVRETFEPRAKVIQEVTKLPGNDGVLTLHARILSAPRANRNWGARNTGARATWARFAMWFVGHGAVGGALPDPHRLACRFQHGEPQRVLR